LHRKRGNTVVQLAEPAADHPRAGVLIGIFVVGATLGTALPWLLAHSHWPASIAATTKTTRQPAPPKAPAAAEPQTAATQVATLQAIAPDPTTIAPKPPAPAIVATPAPAAPRSVTKLARGFVAYLHCDGLERPGRRYPCPRDPALEAQVWRILQSLAHCRDDKPGAGSAELRLTWHGWEPAKIELRSPEPPPSLNLQAVTKCAEPALSALRSRLRSPRLMVSFRFALR
jgi:hypothetical protein